MSLSAAVVFSIAFSGSSAATIPSPLARLEAMDARLVDVMDRLSTANASLCPRQGYSAGWFVTGVNQLGPRLRQEAVTRYELSQRGPYISALAPRGGAAAAGLEVGDTILAIDGRPMPSQASPSRHAGQTEADLIASLFSQTLHSRPVTVDYEREGRQSRTTLVPQLGCQLEAHIDVSPRQYAYTDGQRIVVSSGLTEYAATDDELAFVAAHELAHIILHHSDEQPQSDDRLAARGHPELQADALALQLMSNAGYAAETAPAFLERRHNDQTIFTRLQWGHPTARQRADTARVVLKQMSGG